MIVLSDEDSPSPDGQQPSSDLHALRELLHQEEKKLSMLKTIRGLQGTTVASNGSSTGKIQGSALNKTTGRSSPNITLNRRDLAGSGGTRAIQPKHSIVVVPGNYQLNALPSTTGVPTGISSRLQQLVDTIAVDQALNSSQIRSTRNLKPVANSVTTWSQQGRQATNTPPVPGLTSISPSPVIKPPSISLINDTILSLTSSSIPPLRPKLSSSVHVHRPAHEIITISDSPGSKNPPPLLSTNVGPITVPTATIRGSIQIPTISSTVGSKTLRELAKPTSEKEMRESIESSRRYREYVIKQSTAKKNFQKQMDRKMLLAPYPKTFRQVWPVIPVHDPAFISNFGLEEVTHFFESSLKSPQDRANTTAKVKPICNQCGCDFASAWQIRKSNSKQLLLCESCDFQNLKILQRQKLANQLKDLLDSIKKEEEKFSSECEKQLGKQSYERLTTSSTSMTRNPPPLTSQLYGTPPTKRSTFTPTIVNSNQVIQVSKKQSALVESGKTTSNYATNKPTSMTVISIHPKAVIPSILGQTSSPKTTGLDDARSTTRKRKDPPVSATPPSKAYKPGSTLDVTLNKLSQQLINRKLSEKRQEAGQVPEDGQDKKEAIGEQSPPPQALVMTSGGSEGRRNRRKGKPRHKRHLSTSSATSE